MDGNSIAFLGELLTHLGDSERGLTLATRAKQLNPHHPGWYWYADFFHAYRARDYRAALEIASKVDMPGHWASQMAFAIAHAQLGNDEAWLQGDASDDAIVAAGHGQAVDSRTYGPVPVAALVARAWFRYWPTRRIGRLAAGAAIRARR